MDHFTLKEQILKMSFGGVLYDITEGSDLRVMVESNPLNAHQIVKEVEENPARNGIDTGVANYIKEVLGATA